MWIIGDGYLREKLESSNVKDVTFYWYILNEKKCDLLRRAHLVLMPAIREGWGLVVTEANAMGTPVVGYNVPELSDSIKDGELELSLKKDDPERWPNREFSCFEIPSFFPNTVQVHSNSQGNIVGIILRIRFKELSILMKLTQT